MQRKTKTKSLLCMPSGYKTALCNRLSDKAKKLLRALGIVVLAAIAYFIFSLMFMAKAEAVETEKCKRLKGIIEGELASYYNTPFTAGHICALISVESSFRPHAISRYGAAGIMQITIHALDDYNYFSNRKTIPLRGLFDVEQNIRLGIWYLHRTHKQAVKYAKQKSLTAALSAYFWGLTRAKNKRLIETRYSKKVLARYQYFQQSMGGVANQNMQLPKEYRLVKVAR